ncbi:hypothetical protein BG005_004287, partial [Podila minutissima]
MYKKRSWDRKKSFKAEYDLAVQGIMHCAGQEFNVCHKAEKKPAVLFVYGSATFNTGTSLASLHTSFKGNLFKKVMALGYNVMSADEFKTSS